MRDGQERRRLRRIERERWTDADWNRVRELADQAWDAMVALEDTALYLYCAEQACRAREYERADARLAAIKAEYEHLRSLLRDVGSDDAGRGEDVQKTGEATPLDPAPRSESPRDAGR